jgi:hypothetical protein
MRPCRASLLAAALVLSLTVSGLDAQPAAAPPPVQTLVGRVRPYTLAMTRLAITRNWSARSDALLARVGAQESLGPGWRPDNPHWQQARAGVLRRVMRLADHFGRSAALDELLAAQLGRALVGDGARELATALAAPAGPAILRQDSAIAFVSHVMARESPRLSPADPAWMAQMRDLSALAAAELDRAGLPPDDPAQRGAVEQFRRSSLAPRLGQVMSLALGAAETRLDGAVKLLVDEQAAAIQREIDAAVAAFRRGGGG